MDPAIRNKQRCVIASALILILRLAQDVEGGRAAIQNFLVSLLQLWIASSLRFSQ